MASGIVGLRTRVRSLSPSFLREGVDERIMYVLALGSDAVLSKLTQGVAGRFPTKCNPGFLALLGNDRLIPRGLDESDDSYRVRLQRAFDTWQLAGSARSVLTQLLGFLSGFTVQVRVVSSRFEPSPARIPVQLAQGLGFTVTDASNATPIVVTTSDVHGFATGDRVQIAGVAGNTAANGTRTITVTGALTFSLGGSVGNGAYTSGGRAIAFPAAYPPPRLSSTWDSYPEVSGAVRPASAEPEHVFALAGGNGDWDWDSLSREPMSYAWWGTFIILYAPASGGWIEPDDTWGNNGVWGDGGAWGVNTSTSAGQVIQAIVALLKSGNTVARWVILSFDGMLFDPAQPAGGGINPDGTFGFWHRVVNFEVVQARFQDARYGDGAA